MKKHLLATALLTSCFSANATIVEMQTDLGSITVHLYDQHTPVTVENFLNYVADGSYDGTVIHRSVDNFVLQGGGFKFETDFTEIDQLIECKQRIIELKTLLSELEKEGNADTSSVTNNIQSSIAA